LDVVDRDRARERTEYVVGREVEMCVVCAHDTRYADTVWSVSWVEEGREGRRT
jgi:hypothetical protein